MTNEIILYSTPEGNKKVGFLYHNESFWMTQKAIAELFDVEVPAISKHLGSRRSYFARLMSGVSSG